VTQPAKLGLPQGYRQGLVTAITVFLGFSLSFIRFWNFETAGEWTRTGAAAAVVVAAGIVVQLVALLRSLGLEDDEPAHYTVTVRCFFAGIVVVVVGVLIATIAA
jgi:hypothetical protein